MPRMVRPKKAEKKEEVKKKSETQDEDEDAGDWDGMDYVEDIEAEDEQPEDDADFY